MCIANTEAETDIDKDKERDRETAPQMKAINTLMTLGNSAAKFTSPQSNSTNCCGICAPSHYDLFSHFGQRFLSLSTNLHISGKG